MDTARADLPPSSNSIEDPAPHSLLRFLDSLGSPIDAPREWEPALAEVLIDPADWEQAQLWYQGGTLPLYVQWLSGEKRVLANWQRSGAGRHRLQLLLSGEREGEPLTVTIRPRKITQEQFARLLLDLEIQLPASVALSLQRMGALSGLKLLPPAQTTLDAEVVRLRRAVHGHNGRPGLQSVLERLARNPHRGLHTFHDRVTRERARRPSVAGLVESLSRAHNLDADSRPLRVLDTRVEHTFDVYENRVVKVFYEQVRLRLRRLLPALKAARQLGLWADEMEKMQADLERARRQATFLGEVSQLSQTPLRLTMVLLKRPLYRAAIEGLLELHMSAWVRLEDSNLEAPLENLPTLYQHWGMLQVFNSLLGVAANYGYIVREQNLVRRDREGVYLQILPNGIRAIFLEHPDHGTTAKLFAERSYTSAGSLRSVSYEQRPDVALEVYPRSGKPRVYIFDPKYKLVQDNGEAEVSDGKPKKDDIDKMHAYRDAIRDDTGRHVVEYAAIMYPGSESKLYGNGLEAQSAIPGDEESLQNRLRVVLAEALQP